MDHADIPCTPRPTLAHHLFVDVPIAYPDDPDDALVAVRVLDHERDFFPQHLIEGG